MAHEIGVNRQRVDGQTDVRPQNIMSSQPIVGVGVKKLRTIKTGSISD